MVPESSKKRIKMNIKNIYIFAHDFSSDFRNPKPEKQQFSLRKTTIFTKPAFSKKLEFYIHFGFPKPVKFGPKSLRNRKKSYVKTKIRVNMRIRNFFPTSTCPELAQRARPRKPSQKGLHKVIHLPKYLISTPSLILYYFWRREKKANFDV